MVYPRELAGAIAVGRGRIVVGRQPPAGGAAVDHRTVSRSHLAIEWSAPRTAHVVTDLGSHNGSRVNGRDLPPELPEALEHGAVVQLGDVIAVYEIDAGVDGAAVARAMVPGESAGVRRLRAAIERAAPDPSPVLVIGETGTGKEWIARELHRLSGRAGQLVTVNCAALSAQIIESQLFGHVKGAFTGASGEQRGLFRAADGGTLLLDEIGELPLELQPKLLRALQEGEVQPVGSAQVVPVNVRVIAATNRDLATSVASGEFRRDLYARLALWELRVPALRERRADILDWVDRLHARWLEHRPEASAPAPELLPDAAEALVLHAWPDNLRGLDRLIHELASRPGGGEPLAADQLPAWLREEPSVDEPPPAADAKSSARPPTPSREEFVAAYGELGGNVRALARRFARDRRQIYRWIDAYGLER